jgi:hypothetical protein
MYSESVNERGTEKKGTIAELRDSGSKEAKRGPLQRETMVNLVDGVAWKETGGGIGDQKEGSLSE